MKLNRDQSDLVVVMEHVRNGRLPLALHTNDDLLGHAEDDKHDVRLDHNWPAGIPDKPTMNIKIEDDIPLPGKFGDVERTNELLAALKAMKPGQSFALEVADKQSTAALGTRIRNAAKRLSSKPVVAIRNTKPKEAGGKWTVRTWLLEIENPTPESQSVKVKA